MVEGRAMPIGNRRGTCKRVDYPGQITISPEPTKLELAAKIIDLAMGEDTCYASKVRLARRYSIEQLKDILFLFQSLTAIQ
jgi:hypothetical protein